MPNHSAESSKPIEVAVVVGDAVDIESHRLDEIEPTTRPTEDPRLCPDLVIFGLRMLTTT